HPLLHAFPTRRSTDLGPGSSRDPDVAGRPQALSGGEAGASPATGGPARGGRRVVHPGAETPARGGHRLPQGDVAGDRLARAAGLPSTRSPFRRISPVKRLTALILATVLGVAACGASGGATAATVDGQTITVDDVNGMLSLDEGAVTKTQFAQILGLLVEWSVVEKAAAEELGLTVADDDQSREEFVATRGFTEAFLQMVGHQEALYRKIHDKFLDEGRGVPSEEEIAEGMDARRLAMTSACVSHILLGELQGLEGDE